jgi:purine-binding chemotaxis protein CheW
MDKKTKPAVNQSIKNKQFLAFSLGETLFCIESAVVESTISMQSITFVPQVPDYIEGVTNLRGNVVPVINLNKRLGLPPSTGTPGRRIINIKIKSLEAGLVVDAIHPDIQIDGMNAVMPKDIKTPMTLDFIKAAARVDDRQILLLDLGKVLQNKQ